MKVVALHTDFRIYWPARLKHLSDTLNKRGDELIVIEIAGQGSNYAFAEQNGNNQFNWICLFPNEKIENINPQKAKNTIIQKLNDLNPDVVLAGAIAFTSGAAAVDWAKKNDKAIVIFDDSKKEDVRRNFLINLIKKTIYANVDAILSPSPDWIETFQYWGFKKEAIFFGVDVVDNSFWNKRSTTLFPLDLPKQYFLTVGRLIKCKNYQFLIDAFIKFKKENKNDYELVFAGDGSEKDNLISSIPEDLRNTIHFLPFQDQDSLRTIYQKAEFFILPSLSETWGLVVNEAMATGLPVIASQNVGCSRTLIKEYETGYCFDPTDIDSLIIQLKKAVSLSDGDKNEMKDKCLQLISYWDLDRFSEGAMNAIDYAIKDKRKFIYPISKFLLKKWNGRYNPI